MSSRLDELEVLIDELTLEDFLEKKSFLNDRITILRRKLSDKLDTVSSEYLRSDVYKQKVKAENEAYEKRKSTVAAKRQAYAKWCEGNIKVGDIVRVTGTQSNKIRKVLGIVKSPDHRYHSGSVRNCAYDLTTGREWPQTTTTFFTSITHLYNPTTKELVKISDLINGSDKE